MKINSINTNNMINAYSKQKQYVKTETVNKSFKDKVEISEDAKYLSKINSDNENINIDKVNEIKKKIQEGTYSINSRNIAQKIIDVIKGD
ncbi:flagellar biosynthesis anti-sigma factor FlgM [Clostridioides difficile]